jgi:hypothetical protein
MKFNKWTIGLAAVGVISFASAARADETKMSQVQTALSSTTLSGYVDVAAQYQSASVAAAFPSYATGVGADTIGLNVIDIALDKPLDSTPWASGYHVELWLGPEATAYGLTPIRQAYIALATPIGNSTIDWKIGVWDTIIGYEGLTSANNPNYTHSYGFGIEPTTHTGIQGTYQINSNVSVTAGLADDSHTGGAYSAAVNGVGVGGNGAPAGLLVPTVMGLVALTAPDSFGPLKGATLSVGGMNTGGGANGQSAYNLYAGVTVPTPNTALKFGGSFDYAGSSGFADAYALGLYSTYQFNDKMSLNLRGEYAYAHVIGAGAEGFGAEELTATLSYNLWANVLSRLEVRWDHTSVPGGAFANTTNGGAEKNAFLVAAQLIYTF